MTAIVLSKQRKDTFDSNGKRVFPSNHVFTAALVVILITFIVFVLCLAIFGHRTSQRHSMRGGHDRLRGLNGGRQQVPVSASPCE